MGTLNRMVMITASVLWGCFAFAQAPVKPLKVAVFAPVYLDSAFAGDTYKLGKNNLPRTMMPGLDFYNGVMMAVDSLNKEKTPVEVLFYDTKNENANIEQVTATEEMQDVSLIIASFNTRTEVKPLADFALAKQIPLISSTYPNDAEITGNPFFVLINPTLMAHIDALYKYLHRTFSADNIIVFRRKGDVGGLVQSMFAERNKATPGLPLRLKMVELADNFTPEDVLTNLDSFKMRNIVFCASINETFGANLSKAIAGNKAYRAIAIGMPTWDGIRDISNNLDVIYSTPYNFNREGKLGMRIGDIYKTKYAGRASDMVYKGFESMYHFSKLLVKYGNTLISHLSDKDYKLFNDFDIQPTKASKESMQTDYLENKKFYFIRKRDGLVKTVN